MSELPKWVCFQILKRFNTDDEIRGAKFAARLVLDRVRKTAEDDAKFICSDNDDSYNEGREMVRREILGEE